VLVVVLLFTGSSEHCSCTNSTLIVLKCSRHCYNNNDNNNNNIGIYKVHNIGRAETTLQCNDVEVFGNFFHISVTKYSDLPDATEIVARGGQTGLKVFT